MARIYRRTIKKDHHDLDNHDNVITLLEPDILECEVKWALGSIATNKARGADGVPVELFQILKDDVVKVQQIWKTQQWPRDWKRSVFIPIPKKGQAKERSNDHTVTVISRTRKVMLKILQIRFQQFVNCEDPDVQARLRKCRGTREIKLPTSVVSSKKQERSQKTSSYALLTTPKPLTVWITAKCGNFFKRWE